MTVCAGAWSSKTTSALERVDRFMQLRHDAVQISFEALLFVVT